MTDCFALLNEPRRPWIDPEALKAKFIALSAEVHPDRTHNRPATEREAANQRFAQLNAAYTCLCEPKARLAHLLELERGSRLEEVQKIPCGTAELFMEVSKACREADAFLAARNRTTSPLLKAQSFEKGFQLSDSLKALNGKLDTKLGQLAVQLGNLNMAWESAPAVGSPTRANVLPCSRLEQIYRDLSYLTRWMQQIHGRIVQLSL
jgi:DnaJ-domain-containing protein 1